MKKTVITTLLALGFSSSVMASTNNDLDQIFSAQGNVAELSSQEMQSTQGAFSPFGAMVGFGTGTPGEPSAEMLAYLESLGIDIASLPIGTGFGTGTPGEPSAEMLAYLEGLGIDIASLPIGTGFATEAEALAFSESLGIDIASLTGTGGMGGMRGMRGMASFSQ